MKKKTTPTKKRNYAATDATRININALKKKVAKLERERETIGPLFARVIVEFNDRIDKIEAAVKALKRKK